MDARMAFGLPVQRRVVGTGCGWPGKTPGPLQAMMKGHRAYKLNGCTTASSLADRHVIIAGATTRARVLPQPPAATHGLRQHPTLPRPQVDKDGNSERHTSSIHASTSGRRDARDATGLVLPTARSGSTLSRAQDARFPLHLPRSQVQPSRRQLLHAIAAVAVAAAAPLGGGLAGPGRAAAAEGMAVPAPAPVGSGSAVDLATIQEEAYLAYAERRFQDAVDLLTRCIVQQPGEPRWREMRAEALVDGKNFDAALVDFKDALELTPASELTTRARLLSGRALALEGLSDWQGALGDYTQAMELAEQGGESLDPYILNSIGNCLNSLGRWSEAREYYLASSEVFQRAKGFRGRGGSTTQRLDGAIFAASNAALMLAQMGDTEGAIKEMTRISRRAPGSSDMRAALAALYWQQGRATEAEELWEFACDRINVGCAKYTDPDWLSRIRRWPPVMVQRMGDFLAMR